MCSSDLWRIKKDFEEGIIWGGKGCLGYKVVNKKYVIVPEEAEIVKLIFDYYLNGYGVEMIAKVLNKDKVPTYSRVNAWGKSAIQHILGNYSYTGDLLLQKTYRENFLTKKTRINRGQYTQFLVASDHGPIIDKEVFMEVARIREIGRASCRERV